jgi:hypothetical protein
MKAKSLLLITLLSAGSIANANSGNPEAKSPSYSANKNVVANFGKLNAHRQQQGVALTWTVLSAEGIAGFIIEQSYDGFYFEEIAQVNSDETGRNRYFDNAVYPGFIYYRVTAVYEDGSSETSETTVVRIVSRK